NPQKNRNVRFGPLGTESSPAGPCGVPARNQRVHRKNAVAIFLAAIPLLISGHRPPGRARLQGSLLMARAVVLAGDAGACRDVRLPRSDFLKSALRGTAFGRAFTHLPRQISF